MPFFSSLKDYAKRHRRGLLITATIAGGSYLAGRYATRKIVDMQEKAASERLAKENLKRRFEQNQNDCVFTVLSLMPTLSEEILNTVNIEAMWAKLQESRKLEKKEEAESSKKVQMPDQDPSKEPAEPNQAGQGDEGEATPLGLEASVDSMSASHVSEDTAPTAHPPGWLSKSEKHALWEDVKVSSFTRTLTAMYAVTLLTLLTHVQLNLLGRFTYVWSVSVLNRSEPTIRLQHEDDAEIGFVDPQTERMYLSVSWWLLHRGWRQCMGHVQQAVEAIVGDLPLKSVLTHEESNGVMQQLRDKIEGKDRTGEKDTMPGLIRSWMLPDTPEEEAEFLKQAGFEPEYPMANGSVTLRRLLDETKDFVDSPDFSAVLTLCLDNVYRVFDQRTFAQSLLLGKTGEKRQTLANILPSISRQAHVALAGNEYMDAFAYIKELQAFSAIVYTQYGDEALEA